MSLAHIILAHKNVGQVGRLVRALWHPDDVIVLHIDRRAPAALHTLARDLARSHPNVLVLPARAILWGGAAMAEVQIAGAAAALAHNPHWTHYFTLSGQDFPLQPRAAIFARMRASPEASWVSWFDPLATPHWKNARERLERYYLEWPWLHRMLHLPALGRRLRALLGWNNHLPYLPGFRRRWPDFRYFGGSNHVVLSRAACRHLVSDPRARAITRWLRHSAHANEIAFQSVLRNSPLADLIINDNLRWIDFPHSASPNPRTIVAADFDRLVSSEKLFARKFDEAVDSAILDRLERHLGLPAAR